MSRLDLDAIETQFDEAENEWEQSDASMNIPDLVARIRELGATIERVRGVQLETLLRDAYETGYDDADADFKGYPELVLGFDVWLARELKEFAGIRIGVKDRPTRMKVGDQK